MNSIANGSFSNVISNGALLWPDTTQTNYTVFPNNNINSFSPPPFTLGTHWFPGRSCVYDQPGCTDDGGNGTGLQSIPGSGWGGVPARNQTWWTNNYATPTGIATYPALPPTNYGTANNYDVNATSEIGPGNPSSCTYDWNCNSAGTATAPENFVNIVNPAGTPNGWWSNDNCTPKNPGGDPMEELWVGGGPANTLTGVNVFGDGTADFLPGPYDHAGLEHFASGGTVQAQGTGVAQGNQGMEFGEWKFLDNNANNILSTPNTGNSACPDITGPATNDPLNAQPGYWKYVTRIRAVKVNVPFNLTPSTCANICTGFNPHLSTWHTSWHSFIEELNQTCTCNGVTYYYNNGMPITHGMDYNQIMTLLNTDNKTLEVDQSWCQCNTWHGAECVIESGGSHTSRSACESGSCCSGDPTDPQCN